VLSRNPIFEREICFTPLPWCATWMTPCRDHINRLRNESPVVNNGECARAARRTNQ